MAKVQFNVKDGTEDGTLTEDDITEQLRGMGYNVQGASDDGQSLTFVGSDGKPYQAPVTKVLSKLGYEEPTMGVAPDAASYDSVSGELRAVVSKLPSDTMRKAALEQALQRKGIPGAQVIGSGRDWYFYDPQSGQYKGLTNTPGWDRYDALEAAVELPRIAGSALGAAGGSVVAGPVGGALGAGAGGALADTATRYALSQISPEFKQQAEENMGSMARDVGVGAAVDAGSFGLAKAAGPLVGKILGSNAGALTRGVMNKGVISPVAQGAGAVVENVGSGVAKAARAMQTPFGRSVATSAIPGAAEAELAGEAMALPRAAVRGLPGAMQRLGSSETVNSLSPRAAAWLRGTGQGLRRASSEPLDGLTGRAARAMSMAEESAPHGPTAPGVLRELGERGAKAVGASPQTASTVGQAAHSLGRGLEVAGDLGQGVAKTARGVAGAGLGAVQGGARAAQAVGAGVRRAGTLASPLESRAALTAIGDEYVRDPAREALDRLRRQRLKAKMSQILVNN